MILILGQRLCATFASSRPLIPGIRTSTNIRLISGRARELAEPDSNITEAVDEVFEAALAYQGEFAHAAKAGTDSGYNFPPAAGRFTNTRRHRSPYPRVTSS
jgi:hypothetical protein